jgi:hypothetical protein
MSIIYARLELIHWCDKICHWCLCRYRKFSRCNNNLGQHNNYCIVYPKLFEWEILCKFADKFSWSIASSGSIWATEGGEGACNSGAIGIQIHVRNWAWQYVYVYGLGHSNRRTISKYGKFSAWIYISMAPGRTRQLHAPSPLICSCFQPCLLSIMNLKFHGGNFTTILLPAKSAKHFNFIILG